MLRWRTVTALVLAPITLAAIVIGKWAILAVLLVVIAGAAYELSRALEPLPFLAAFGAGALPLLLSIPYRETGILAGAVCRPTVGAVLARRQAGDADAARGTRRLADVALGRHAAGASRPVSRH